MHRSGSSLLPFALVGLASCAGASSPPPAALAAPNASAPSGEAPPSTATTAPHADAAQPCSPTHGAPSPSRPVCTAQGAGARLEADFVTLDPPLRFLGGRVDPRSLPVLDGLAEVLTRCPTATIEVRVSARGGGGATQGAPLAGPQAGAVRAALESRGIAPVRVRTRGIPGAAWLDDLPSGDAVGAETQIVRTDVVGCAE